MQKAGSQLNAIGRLRKYIGFPEKKALIEAFVYSNFNYCPLVWHFTSMRSTNKIESIQKIQTRMEQNALDHWDLRFRILYQSRIKKRRNLNCTFSESD